MKRSFIHASLFSGIGGFDLAAKWASWDNAFNCEIDKFCQKVLKYHFPDATQYGDIHATDFTVWRGRVDVLTGGFPCQPFSVAGKRLGTSDDRYLWPEMLRAIREISPRWVVGENVRGFVNWNDGLVLETVCSDLERAGFEVQPFLIPACGVDAPHIRERIWIVAHRHDSGLENTRPERNGISQPKYATYSDTQRWNKQLNPKKSDKAERQPLINAAELCSGDCFARFPTESPICCRDDGFPARLDGITFPAWVNKSIQAFGNAIVPQVAYRIFESINQYETITNR